MTDVAPTMGLWVIDPDSSLPNALILEDSISIGYTLPVRELLASEANVFRPVLVDGSKPENCQGTTFSLERINRWLGDRDWDVIRFNWGLHDLKHVTVAGSSQNSTDPEDSVQATAERYRENLKTLVEKLKSTGARLVFATTTPLVPDSAGPLRDPASPVVYNEYHALKRDRGE